MFVGPLFALNCWSSFLLTQLALSVWETNSKSCNCYHYGKRVRFYLQTRLHSWAIFKFNCPQSIFYQYGPNKHIPSPTLKLSSIHPALLILNPLPLLYSSFLSIIHMITLARNMVVIWDSFPLFLEFYVVNFYFFIISKFLPFQLSMFDTG